MSATKTQEIRFLTGSQDMYGEETLRQVTEHSRRMAAFLDESGKLPARLVWKPILTRPDAITEACLAANSAPQCAGVITWMHTFSPAKMWIAGLTRLDKPLLHLHTQFNRELPWADIDMDFMNLNQAAHGDREYGFIGARLRLPRKVVVGFWQDDEVLSSLDGWARSALAFAESRRLKIARFGGTNMREVAVTGGDRVEAQIKLGWAVNGHAVGDLVRRVQAVSDAQVKELTDEYEATYAVVPMLRKGGERHEELRHVARQEAGMKAFLEEGEFGAFTTTFEDLHGLHELPGFASQRLMAQGYGFAAEGDWKTAALVRLMKVMSAGRPGGVSFMEDYTYHLEKGSELVLGAHMLEVCPSIAEGKPSLEIHKLGIGGKADPVQARLRGRRRPGGVHLPGGHGRPHAAHRGRGGRGEAAPRPAEAAGGAGGVGAAARLQARSDGLDPGGRRPPHELQPRRHRRAARGPRHHGRAGSGAHRCQVRPPRAAERAALERRHLQARVVRRPRRQHDFIPVLSSPLLSASLRTRAGPSSTGHTWARPASKRGACRERSMNELSVP